MSLHLVTGYAGQAHIKAANHGAFNAAVVGSGKYVLDSGNMMMASVLSANKIRIYDGICLNQGRHIQIDPDTYEEVVIENGTQGYMRNDIIVMRYSKDAETDIETASLVVIKGTPVEVSPADPEHAEGSILNGALVDDMPLYRVPLDGLTVGELVPLFEIKPSLDNMIISDLDEMSAITEEKKYVPDAKAIGELISGLEGDILWEMPSDITQMVDGYEINLSKPDTDYKSITIYYTNKCGSLGSVRSVNIPVEVAEGVNWSSAVLDWFLYKSSTLNLRMRNITRLSATLITTGVCYTQPLGSSTTSTENQYVAPFMIVGNKFIK